LSEATGRDSAHRAERVKSPDLGPGAHWSLVVGALLVCALTASVLLWAGSQLRASSKASTPGLGGWAAAAEAAPDNWRYLVAEAQQELLLSRPANAELLFSSAIERYGACARCWLGLAESRWRQRKDFEVELARARELGRADTRVRQLAAVFLAQIGRRDEALSEFLVALGGARGSRSSVFATLELSYLSEEILPALAGARPDLLIYYWEYVLGVHEAGLVGSVWQVLPEVEKTKGVRGRYVDYLLRRGFYRDAWQVWFDEPSSLKSIAGGDFEELGLAGRFDWRLRRDEGVRVAVQDCRDCEDGGDALQLIFDGRHNADYTGTMIFVPLEPGASYDLKFRARYDEITSAAGPQVVVSGQAAGDECNFRFASEPFRLSEPWHDVTVAISVPAACDGARIAVVRRSTDEPNGHISGELWLDDFELLPRS
jgi:hypothetical protein